VRVRGQRFDNFRMEKVLGPTQTPN
jgi:hypothetical protein